jgi:hypothetical protein
MAIINSSVKLIIRERSLYRFSGPALALGIPEIYATYSNLKEWFPDLAGEECRLTAKDIKITTNEVGRNLGWVTSDTFFKCLGISEITSVDIPGCEHQPDLVHDWNDPLPQHFINRFSLVIDPGTIEHVFDIKTGLVNIVRALKIGGVIIQQVPIYSYNGGYYSINPNVLNDFYTANGFSELKTFIIMWDRFHPYIGKNRCYAYSENILGTRHALSDSDQCRFSPHMLFFARKTKEIMDFVNPLQFSGQYFQRNSAEQVKKKLSIAKIGLRHTFTALYKVLPYSYAFAVEAKIRRCIQLYRTRRDSFWI